MNFTNQLYSRFKSRSVQPKCKAFFEVIPLCSKNGVENRPQRVAQNACVEELQLLFGCLKKWEFDDLPCAKFQDTYMRCINENEEKKRKFKAIHKDAPIGGTDGEPTPKTLTAGQFNKLMKLYPQPDLGQYPYRLMQRLPSQSYADDIFRRKKTPGKPS